jgi:hypothetical protein
MSSHLDFFPENCYSISDEHCERFHQDITALESRYKAKWSPSMLADYCWTLMHDSPNLTFIWQAKKTQMHYSYTQLSTYDIVQVRDDNSKTVASEAFLL